MNRLRCWGEEGIHLTFLPPLLYSFLHIWFVDSCWYLCNSFHTWYFKIPSFFISWKVTTKTLSHQVWPDITHSNLPPPPLKKVEVMVLLRMFHTKTDMMWYYATPWNREEKNSTSITYHCSNFWWPFMIQKCPFARSSGLEYHWGMKKQSPVTWKARQHFYCFFNTTMPCIVVLGMRKGL